MIINDFLSSEAVLFSHRSTSKKRVLQDVCDLAHSLYGIETGITFDALNEREKLGSTGVGHGVAIPHARLAQLSSVHGFFTRLEHPIDFDAIDRQPVDMIFTILAPKDEGADHLKALAAVSRALRSEELCNKLRANSDPKALFSILTEETSVKAA